MKSPASFSVSVGLLAGFLSPASEREPVGLDERVVDGIVVSVDEGDRIAPMQEQIVGVIVRPFCSTMRMALERPA